MSHSAEHIPIQKMRLRTVGILYAVIALVVFLGMFALAENLNGNWVITVKITGGIIAALLVLTGAGAVKLLSDKNAGLHLHANGFEDHSTAIAVGRVGWKNVASLQPDEKAKHICVMLKNPQDVIKAAPNKAIRQLLERNYAMYKTPVILESKYLDCSFTELIEKLNHWYKPGGKK